MDNKSMFFKVFLLPTSSQKLLIPLAFSAQMKGSFPKQALLKNQRGKVWSVKIVNKEIKFYFTNGWPKFVKNNNVEDGDFLLFNYDKSHVFYVTIYDKTACNKMIVEYEESENEEEGSDEEIEEFEIDETYEENNEYGDETDEEEFEMENNKTGKRKLVQNFEGKGKGKEKIVKDDKRMQMVVVSSHVDVGALSIKRKNILHNAYKKDFGNNGSTSKGIETFVTITKENHNGNKAAKPIGKAKKKNDTNPKGKASEASDDEDEIFKHGIVARPKPPYFVTKLHAKRPNKLYIPLDVIRDFNLEIPEKIIILDEENKEWQSDVRVWGDTRTWLTNGWKAFRKWNALTWHDRCLCEFVKDSGPRGLFLKIRILREGSWLPKVDN